MATITSSDIPSPSETTITTATKDEIPKSSRKTISFGDPKSTRRTKTLKVREKSPKSSNRRVASSNPTEKEDDKTTTVVASKGYDIISPKSELLMSPILAAKRILKSPTTPKLELPTIVNVNHSKAYDSAPPSSIVDTFRTIRNIGNRNTKVHAESDLDLINHKVSEEVKLENHLLRIVEDVVKPGLETKPFGGEEDHFFHAERMLALLSGGTVKSRDISSAKVSGILQEEGR